MKKILVSALLLAVSSSALVSAGIQTTSYQGGQGHYGHHHGAGSMQAGKTGHHRHHKGKKGKHGHMGQHGQHGQQDQQGHGWHRHGGQQAGGMYGSSQGGKYGRVAATSSNN